METDGLVGLSEVALMANPPVTRQAVANWRKRFDDFPAPAQTLQCGPVWKKDIMEEWLRRHSDAAPVVLSFINLKGGVAKTTTSVAVAEVLAAEHRKHVLFIDLDPQTNATISLIGEEEWSKRDAAGQTLAQLFKDKIQCDREAVFDIEQAIVRNVSEVNGGIPRLELLPSSIQFIELQERLPFVGVQHNFQINPQDILRKALQPVIERYDYIIIDCPPSLGIVTKNGLRFSTHYCIPTIPDILSTWGIFQIVQNVADFADSINCRIIPVGIVATKVRPIGLHQRMIDDLRQGRLFQGKATGLQQPPLLENRLLERAKTAEGVNADAGPFTFRQKYGSDNYNELRAITRELVQRCGK